MVPTITDAGNERKPLRFITRHAQQRQKYTLNNIQQHTCYVAKHGNNHSCLLWRPLYTDNGNYMETKSPYYTIVNLMKNRIKYVSGGQAQRSYWLPTDGKMDNSDVELYRTNEVYASVRYGVIMTADDTEGSKYSVHLVR